MDVTIACVIPYALSLEFKSVKVGGTFVVSLGVRATVAPASYVSADETYPEVGVGGCIWGAIGAMRSGRRRKGYWDGRAGGVGGCWMRRTERLGVATNGTSGGYISVRMEGSKGREFTCCRPIY